MAQAGSKNMTLRNADGGWAWIILASVAIFSFNTGGALKLTGVLYVEFLDLFQAGPVVTSWIGSAFGIMVMIGAVLGGYIADTLGFQIRRIFLFCFLLLAVVGVAVSGWVPNVTGVIICYGILTGFSIGIAAAPILSLPGVYFKKRRSLAYGITFTGSTLASLVMPIVLTLLVEEYSIRGTLLIFSGFWLHTLFGPASMTPVKDTVKSNHGSEINAEAESDETGLRLVTKPVNGDSEPSLLKEPLNDCMVITKEGSTGDDIPAVSDIKPSFEEYSVSPIDDKEATTQLMGRELSGRVFTCPEAKSDVAEDVGDLHINSATKRTSYCSSSDGYCHFVMSYVAMMRSPGVTPLCFCLLCGYFSYFNQFLILPPLARELNMSKLEGALLVTLPNGPEFVARIIVGVLVDKCQISKQKILISSYLLAGMLGIIISFIRHTAAYLAYSVAYGAVGGVCTTLGIPMVMDIVTPEHYGKASAMYGVLAGLGSAIGLPILTLIADQTGTFVNSIRLCAGVYLLGALVHIGVTYYNTRRNRGSDREPNTNALE